MATTADQSVPTPTTLPTFDSYTAFVVDAGRNGPPLGFVTGEEADEYVASHPYASRVEEREVEPIRAWLKS